jgi:phosphatidylserine/phosphatidylglycerophosphate/cardiolipin synthase-like enzyme
MAFIVDLDWVLVATGASGAYTLLFLCRCLHRLLRPAASYAVYFSPKGGCTDVVVREILAARQELLILAYSFTARVISEAVLAAKKRGVNVEVILDHSNEKEEHTDLGFLLQAGVQPLVDAQHAIAHNKIMIIDRRTVITGSFNFTRQAERENAENLVVVKHDPDLVAAYRQNFAAHKAHARAPQIQPAAPSRWAA